MPQAIPIYQIDAFTSETFKGNPAAVCVLEQWLPEATMQSIAFENNLSETAFLLPNTDGNYQIRWFTPSYEVPICGHATLASAYVVCEMLQKREQVTFISEQHQLNIRYDGNLFTMTFPTDALKVIETPEILQKGLSENIIECFTGRRTMVVLQDEAAVRNLQLANSLAEDMPELKLIVTAPGATADFVQRYFIPSENRLEDPVTGSALCSTLPYWHDKMQKPQYHIQQLSKRGGDLWAKPIENKIEISGQAICYLQGEINI